MKYPRLKNPLLCRILVYIVVIGGAFLPAFVAIIAAAIFDFIPAYIPGFVFIGSLIGLLMYVIKNFLCLIGMDMMLALLHCQNSARKCFVLPQSFTVEKAGRKISRFGKKFEPTALFPRPAMLQYKSNAPMTVHSSGIEKVIATYMVDFLDKSSYLSIVSSAKANSNALEGKKKHLFLDKAQKTSPLNRVTVVFIFAKSVDEKFRMDLSHSVCKNSGDGFNIAVLPCVVDLETRLCTFDSLRIPYIGFQYAVKNRGIKIIRKFLFHNKLPLADSPDFLDPMDDIDPEESLWSFWKKTKKDLISDEKGIKKRLEKMEHGEIVLKDDSLYLKWEDRGICASVELNQELRTAQISEIEFWSYPKSHKIAKDTIQELKSFLNTYFARLGYTTQYLPKDE